MPLSTLIFEIKFHAKLKYFIKIQGFSCYLYQMLNIDFGK